MVQVVAVEALVFFVCLGVVAHVGNAVEDLFFFVCLADGVVAHPGSSSLRLLGQLLFVFSSRHRLLGQLQFLQLVL